MELNEIEHKIACGEMSATQVFTQMKQHIGDTDSARIRWRDRYSSLFTNIKIHEKLLKKYMPDGIFEMFLKWQIEVDDEL